MLVTSLIPHTFTVSPTLNPLTPSLQLLKVSELLQSCYFLLQWVLPSGCAGFELPFSVPAHELKH